MYLSTSYTILLLLGGDLKRTVCGVEIMLKAKRTRTDRQSQLLKQMGGQKKLFDSSKKSTKEMSVILYIITD